MTKDTFEWCDTHADMWEPGCERCEKCSQHHNQVDVKSWLTIIDRKAYPEMESLEAKPVSEYPVVIMATVKYERLKACEAALEQIAHKEGIPHANNLWDSGYHCGIGECRHIAKKALGETEVPS